MQRSKELLYALFAVMACALLVASFTRAQAPKPTPATPRQYVIACAVDELQDAVRRANEAGYAVQLVNECMAVDTKVVCIVSSGDVEEEEGR